MNVSVLVVTHPEPLIAHGLRIPPTVVMVTSTGREGALSSVTLTHNSSMAYILLCFIYSLKAYTEHEH